MTVTKKSDLEQLLSDIHSYGINHHTREIYIHGAYGGSHCDEEEPGVGYRMATAFVKNLHVLEAQEQSNILIHLHSIGGEWTDGMAMFHAARFAKSPVTILAYAQASSMSGIILQCADKRILMPDTEFMIHHGSIAVHDNSMAAKSAIDVNERQCKRMLRIFAKRAILSPYFKEREYTEAKVVSFIDRKIKSNSDWCMDAEEAVYYGFADGILGEKGYESIDKIRVGRKFKGRI